ncbi:MAG: hypothetical protein NT121_03755 [Chloroflexi bacterium]|nr:hypothetical protein [Chloroflexota bacterium]
MPARIKPLLKTFPLPKTDFLYGNDNPEEITTVTIKQADQGTASLRAAELNDFDIERTIQDEGSSAVAKKRISFSVIRKIEVCNTVVGCNLQDAEGNSFFKFLPNEAGPASQEAFWRRWNMLDPTVANEIYGHILEMNPDWDPDAPKD